MKVGPMGSDGAKPPCGMQDGMVWKVEGRRSDAEASEAARWGPSGGVDSDQVSAGKLSGRESTRSDRADVQAVLPR